MEKRGIALPPEDLQDTMERHAYRKAQMRSYEASDNELVVAEQEMQQEIQKYISSIKSY